jgi:PAS domain S-box-containing protein
MSIATTKNPPKVTGGGTNPIQSSKSENTLLRLLLEQGNAGLAVLGVDGIPRYVSPSVKMILGYSTKEALTLNLFDLVHPEDKESVRQVFFRVLEHPGRPVQGTASRIRHKNGSWRWLDATLTNFLDHPDIGGIVDNFRDVTDRVEAELAKERVAHQLRERFKEQACLYAISNLGNQDLALPTYFAKVATNLPSGWQYPDVAGAAIFFEGKWYKSPKYKVTRWMLGASRHLSNGHELAVRVVYTKEMPQAHHGPFLKEEQQLIEQVADLLHQRVERHRVNLALTQSEKHLRLILDSEPECVKVVNRDFSLNQMNHAGLELIEATDRPEQVIGKNVVQLIHPKDKDNFRKLHKAALGGRKEFGTFRIKGLNGTIKWVESSMVPMYDHHNRIYAVLSVTRDISRRLSAERAREAERREKEALINSTEDLIWSIDKDFRLLAANKAMTQSLEKHYGISISPGSLILDGDWGKEYSDYWRSLYSRALRGEVFSVESSASTPDGGQTEWFETRLTPIRNGKKVIGVACHARDISLRKDHEQNLDALNTKLKAAQQIAQLGYWELILKTNELHWSDEVYRIWDTTPKKFKVSFEAFYSTIHPDDVVKFNKFQLSARRGKGDLDFKHRIVLKNGKVKWVHERGHVIYRDNKPFALTGTIQDVTDFQKTLEQLQLSNERFERVSEATRDALWEWDMQTNSLFWGESYRQKYGPLSTRHLKLSHWKKKVYPADISRVVNSLQEAVSDVSIRYWESEYRYTNINGEYLFVRDRGSIIRDSQGKAIRIVGAISDITQSRKVEMQKSLINDIRQCFNETTGLLESIHHSLNHLLAFADSHLAELWLVDQQSNQIKLKSKAGVLNDLEVFYEDIDKTLSFKYGQGLPGLVWKTQRIIQWNQAEIKRKFVRKRAAEQLGLKQVTGVPLFNRHSEFLGMVLLGNFDTIPGLPFVPDWEEVGRELGSEIQRKQMEQEFVQIFNTAPDVVCVVDREGYFIKINSKGVELLEYSEEELLSKPFLHYVHPDDQAATRFELMKILNGRNSFEFENKYVCKSGKIKWISWAASPVLSDGVIYVIGRDISARRAAEEKLKELNRELERRAEELVAINHDLEQFAFVASHDLQEPLRTVTSFLTMLERKYGHTLDEKGKQYIDFAVSSSKRMRQIILDVLEYSRADKYANIESLDLNALVQRVIKYNQGLMQELGAVITVKHLPTISSFKTPLEQIFQNLLLNALKYHRPGLKPRIHIITKELDTEWQFEVKDNGMGIEPEYFKKIFHLFQRLHPASGHDGTGMGLAITKRIIGKMGGRIWVKSKMGKGSSFYFTIPKA